MDKVILIFRKEILDAVRDSRTFYICVITPFLLYPVLFLLMGYFIESEKAKEAKLIYKIEIINHSTLPGLLDRIKATKKFEIIKTMNPVGVLKKRKLKVVLEVEDKNKITIFYDGANKESQNALRRLDKIISEYQDSIIKKRILEAALPADIIKPITVNKENIAPAERMGGFFLGILIPYILIIVAFSGALHVASDITAGEKERKTIETILVTDVKRSEIVLGKCCAVFILTLLATISGLLGLLITIQSGFLFFAQIDQKLPLSVPWLSCFLILIVILPLLWLFSSLLVAIGSASKSVKQATNYGSYCLIGVIILAMFSVMRITSPNNSTFLIPVLNTAILQQQILIGEVNEFNLFVAIVSNIFYATVAYLVARNNFEKEEILLRS
ncbi:MAG: hypothetical protein B5M53_05510 [Candidatus Cloacimonas sp. 4484_209]|nr:MAG: hypothetical protein B5M53_05510 [Candidatus Cloacimonas sp. 4484_209]